MIPDEDFPLREILAVYVQDEPSPHPFQRGPSRIYVEAHGVSVTRGKPVLLAGKPLSVRAARRLAKALDEQTRTAGHGMLPERILAASPGGDLAWWAPACRRHLRLAGDIGLTSGEAPMPALLFALKGARLFVFALKTGGKRPQDKAKLFRLPLWNCHVDGGMCMGSARFGRDGTAAERMAEAEGAFWSSDFCAHLGGGDRVRGGTLSALWVTLIGVKGSRFPLGRLLPQGGTVGDYLRREGF